ncbi:hypothetical protein [Saccharothrix australiensis]|uniref:Uncharacterized protein n=1 Tax=Saccharothrix australiensis TaxID=2072 RepID=A0A495W4M0_9PSEU|nr:hypothetical protein [Saccharothrix australiensis]RKT55603.1 hypothetical protein C8E97_4283 [Saccharothrix australiensis]
MTEHWYPLHVIDHGFAVLDHGDLPMTPGGWSNGLVRALPAGALIYTGISQGYVRVHAATTPDEPAVPAETSWEEIVDISVTAPRGGLRVDSHEHGAPAALPLLSTQGPGTYRLRVHARGRDRHYDQVHTDPGEDYLILCWPSPWASESVIRATDDCGRQLRQTTPPPTPATPPSTAGQDVVEANHQAILKLIAESHRPSQ